MSTWISANGGLIASVVIIVGCLNMILSGIQTLCNKLKVQEPSGIQKVASWVSTVSGWLSANTPTTPATTAASAPTTTSTTASK